MARLLNIRDRGDHAFGVSRMFWFYDYSVVLDERDLASVQDCKRMMAHFASHGVWWLVGRIYGELHSGRLPSTRLGETAVGEEGS